MSRPNIDDAYWAYLSLADRRGHADRLTVRAWRRYRGLKREADRRAAAAHKAAVRQAEIYAI